MVALGEKGTAVDFVVVQFANGVGLEDCQEVYLEREDGAEPSGKDAISVKLGPVVGKAKL
jgi:ureidoglycolate lyase